MQKVTLDTVTIGHSNIPEYEKLHHDETMEILRNRIVKIDVIRFLETSHKLNVLFKNYSSGKYIAVL